MLLQMCYSYLCLLRLPSLHTFCQATVVCWTLICLYLLLDVDYHINLHICCRWLAYGGSRHITECPWLSDNQGLNGGNG